MTIMRHVSQFKITIYHRELLTKISITKIKGMFIIVYGLYSKYSLSGYFEKNLCTFA